MSSSRVGVEEVAVLLLLYYMDTAVHAFWQRSGRRETKRHRHVTLAFLRGRGST